MLAGTILATFAVAAPAAQAAGPISQIVRSKIGGDQYPLTDQNSANIEPTWSPDGSEVVFASNRDGTYHLYEVSSDGGEETQLTSGPWNDTHPAWSPDGTKIAFASDRAGNEDIYTMNADGSGIQRITGSPASDTQPAWSPDGSRIAFVSNRYGSMDVFTVGEHGGGLERLTYSVADDTQPTWSPDGSSIAFTSDRSGYANVWVVPAGGGTAEPATSDQAIDVQPAWKPTGTAFAFSSGVAPPPSQADWGIYSASRGGLSGDQLIAQLQTDIGRQFSAERFYQNFSTFDVPTTDMTDLASRGALIYLNVNSFFVRDGHSSCAPWADVAAGRYDSLLTHFAQEIIAFDYPIDLGFNHEMTNDVPHHPVCGTPADYVRAYNHIHALFGSLGVTTVTWVWAPTASSFIHHTAERYVPAGYDVVGVDGYNRARRWRSPSYIFTAAHQFAVKHGKALLIGEIGCDEWPGLPYRKAFWIQSAAAMFQSWSDLQAIIWTNTGADGHRFWLDSSGPSLTMFRMASVHFR